VTTVLTHPQPRIMLMALGRRDVDDEIVRTTWAGESLSCAEIRAA
jgi:hypothetical protein